MTDKERIVKLEAALRAKMEKLGDIERHRDVWKQDAKAQLERAESAETALAVAQERIKQNQR